MFGYVICDKPNLLIKDYTTYRAHYCGLCKSIGKIESQSLRFSINYDIAFLSLIAHNYCKVTPTFSEEHCIAHPIGRKILVVDHNAVQEKIVDINTILGYFKIDDDVMDENKIKHRLIFQYLKRKYKRAKLRMPMLCEQISLHYSNLRTLEIAKTDSIDQLSHCFAEIMKAVGREVCLNFDDNLDILCYNLGRWIYLIDAYDDIKQDNLEHKFNAFNPTDAPLTEELLASIKENASINLKLAVSKIRKAYDLMTISISEGPLSNIVYLGLSKRTNDILSKGGSKCQETHL